jgi:hypothetical protein
MTLAKRPTGSHGVEGRRHAFTLPDHVDRVRERSRSWKVDGVTECALVFDALRLAAKQ